MTMRLELVPIAVSDVDATVAFYRDVVGFTLDHDVSPGGGMRVVQLTPPGSACSIAFGVGMGSGGPVSNLHLVVDDVEAERAALVGRGLAVSEVQDMGGVLYAFFADPDGNTWALQEIRVASLPQ
ncbi:VOC family protein [Microbacterium sp. BH-3-3-3]|uniref:VOC family protein n=1 Tax=Microbacterium sp. BH-3-3-3 TaxID=1906742 RepID=UPI0008929B51|nr:VOC family protein [Microbacterium sp. BH-3-3-3]AOX46671.1 glyoxalase [Microbacterium sp. BH-3-3-3]